MKVSYLLSLPGRSSLIIFFHACSSFSPPHLSMVEILDCIQLSKNFLTTLLTSSGLVSMEPSFSSSMAEEISSNCLTTLNRLFRHFPLPFPVSSSKFFCLCSVKARIFPLMSFWWAFISCTAILSACSTSLSLIFHDVSTLQLWQFLLLGGCLPPAMAWSLSHISCRSLMLSITNPSGSLSSHHPASLSILFMFILLGSLPLAAISRALLAPVIFPDHAFRWCPHPSLY